MSFNEAVRKLGLNEMQVRELQVIARRTWNVIADDCGDIEKKSEIAEIVLDADYMKMYGELNKATEQVQQCLASDNYDALLVVVAAAF